MVRYKSELGVKEVDNMSQGVRVTNMLYNHGPGSILETVDGPVVVKGWNEMIGKITSFSQIKDSRINLLRKLEIIEPRLSSQLIGTKESGITRVKLHSLPTNESLKLETTKALVSTNDFPNYMLCRKGEGHKEKSILYDGEYGEACPICNNRERSSPIRFVAACTDTYKICRGNL